MERLPVVLALSPLAERSVEQLLFGRTAILEPRASANDAAELEQELSLAQATAVLVSVDLPGLTAAHCAQVRGRGTRIVGLAHDAYERQQLLSLGVDEVVEPGDSEQTVLAALKGQQTPDTNTLEHPPDEPTPVTTGPGEPAGGGSLLVVLGSKGAPGASECAASLAALAATRWACVLVELDALGGGLDLRLGADPREGSLLGLARAVAAGDGAVGELLERWLVTRPGWPPVLVGPPDPTAALSELAQPGATAAVLRALASVYPLAVVDLGFLLHDGDAPTPVARLHCEALVAADAILLILGAREEQLRAGLAQLDTLLALGVPPERLRVILNAAGGPGAVPGSTLAQLVAVQLAERRFALDATLPWDGRALSRAQRNGLPLATARRRGPYTRALNRLLEQLFLPVAPAPRERKLRLVPPVPTELQHDLSIDLDKAEEVALPWRS